ncbi:helix-turn-helix transcriptional regulator [Eubacteriales bacterium OttesenSCG-928-K08]|nr:helix-turn-helix transcriptional regulator [Eubacteriales bacterium OttesenSCG-928-K08]MDL2288606.1 helix-turn-helix transcriptional regulator [Oscillospiraceae bacterium OttesenSCG-928-F05]MDL2300081.1 helix-turn-helix transcriptional regulator [Clostridiaceae bacterium OttesenSCG-928-D20]
MENKTEPFDFRTLGKAIKHAREANGYTREQLGDMIGLTARYLVDIENEGQPPSLQVLYSLVTIFDISVDQFFFPNKNAEKDTQRRQLERLLDDMDSRDLTIMTATAKGIIEVKTE